MDFIVASLALTAPLRTGTGDMQGSRPTQTPLFRNSTSSALQPATTATINATSIAANITSSPSLASSNTTRAPDLNNATECWSYSWSYSLASDDWDRSHQETSWIVSTSTVTIATGYPPLPTATGNASFGNLSWTTYCDGLPRFTDEEEASKLQVITLPTPIVTSTVHTRLSIGPVTEPNPYPWRGAPSCNINGTSECTNLWNMFATTLLGSLSTWSSKNILTISVPATPTAVVVNGQSTPLITAAPGQLPPLPILSSTYLPRVDHAGSAWYIDDAFNYIGETAIAPGQQVTFTFNVWETTRKPFGPTCEDGLPSTPDLEQCAKTRQCTIRAKSVELLFFPPPSSSSDLCANTSPGYNSYSQSIYSQPHQSAVVNGTTFWADKAYVRYNTVSAYRWCDYRSGIGQSSVPFGNTYTDAYVEVESRDISTMCGWQMGERGLVVAATPRPMNFADLSGPVPSSAYNCLPLCDLRGGCDSIVQTLFQPYLAVPPQVRALDPEWADCVPYFEGTQDPPIALTAIPDFLTSTPVPPPAPGSTPTNGQPGPSSGPNTAEPTRPADPPLDPPSGSPSNPPNNPPNNSPPNNSPPNNSPPNNSPPNNSPPNNSPPNNSPPNNNPPNNGPSNQPGGNTGSPTGSPPQGSNSPADPSGGTGNTPGSPPQDPSNNNPTNPGGSNPGSSNPGGSNPGGSNPGGGNGGGGNGGGNRPVTTITPQPINIDPTQSVETEAQATGTNSDSGRSDLTVGTPTTINGIPVTVQPDGSIAVTDPNGNQQTVRPGQNQISVNGHTVFVSPLGDKLVVDGQVHSISQQQSSTVRVADIPMILNPDGTIAVIAGGVRQTLQVGGPAITVNGRTISLAPNGQMIVDGKTYTWDTTPDSSGNIYVTGPDGSKTAIALSPTSSGFGGSPSGSNKAAQATATSSSTSGAGEGDSEDSQTGGSSGTNGVTPTGSSEGPGSTDSSSSATGAASGLRLVDGWIVCSSVLAAMMMMMMMSILSW